MRSISDAFSKATSRCGMFANEDLKKSRSFTPTSADVFLPNESKFGTARMRHYETQIESSTPLSKESLGYLRACAGYQGSATYGKVHVLIEKEFWKWLKLCDTSLVGQAYVDAAFILGAHRSAAANEAMLSLEAFGDDHLRQPEVEIMNARQEKASIEVQVAHTDQSLSKSLLGGRLSKTQKKAYAQSTNGGDLKSDLKLHAQALNFQNALKELTRFDDPAYSQNVLQKMIWKGEKEGQLIVVALKRLDMLYLNQSSR